MGKEGLMNLIYSECKRSRRGKANYINSFSYAGRYYRDGKVPNVTKNKERQETLERNCAGI